MSLESHKISVIIPVYNVENLLDKCIQSVLNQTYQNLELILIDDGSLDNSGKMCDEYAKKDERIRVIHQENRGQAKARNAGLDIATGDYVMFVDADDYIEVDTLELINQAIEENQADCVLFDYYFRRKIPHIRKSLLKGNQGKICKSDAFVYSTGSTWGKVYLLKNIKNNHIEFPDLKRNEDMPFNKLAISVSQSIYYLQKPLYNYVNNENSLMHNGKLADEKNAIQAFELLYDRLNDEFSEELEAIFLKQYLYATTLTLVRKKCSTKEIKNQIEICEKKYPNIYKNKALKHMNLFQKLWVFFIKHKMIFALRMLIKLKTILNRIR